MIAERPIAAIEQVDGLQGALDGKEAALGNPASDGLVLASTTAGVRSWVPSGSEVLSSVTVLSTDHPASWSADAATDVLTSSVAHGITVNTPIAFGAGTGALPAGLSPEPEFYRVVAVPSTTTLQVSLTIGGAAVDITGAGTAGWVVKQLPSASSATLLKTGLIDIDVAEDVDVFFFTQPVGKASLNWYPRISCASSITQEFYTSWVTGGYGIPSCGTLSANHTKKYSQSLTVVRLRKMSDGVAAVSLAHHGVTSDAVTRESPSAVGSTGGGILTYSSALPFSLYDGYSGYFESGATCVAVRRP